MNYLGIDYGLKHVGLAFSEGVFAEPFGELVNHGDVELVKKLADLCIDKKLDMVIVGISEGEMAELTQKFAMLLAAAIDAKVHLHDEAYTSKIAVKKMIEGGSSRKKRQTQQHQIAAAVILQDYLDTL